MLNIRALDVIKQGDNSYSVYVDDKDFERISGYKIPEQFSETFIGRIELQDLKSPLDEKDIQFKAVGEAWDDVESESDSGYDTYSIKISLDEAKQIKETILLEYA